MRHPTYAAFIENKTKDGHNFGSDFSQTFNSVHEHKFSTSATSSEAALCINEFYMLSQSKHNKCGKRSGTLSRNNVITVSNDKFLNTLPEIHSSTSSRKDKLLQNREHANVSSFTSQQNNTLTAINNDYHIANSKSNFYLQTLQNPKSATSHQILNISGVSSALEITNFKRAVQQNEQVSSRDVRSHPDVFKTIFKTNNKEKKAEFINVQSKPSIYNAVQITHHSTQSSNLLSIEALAYTTDRVDCTETAPKSQIEAWNQFQSHINMIDDLTSSATQQLMKPFRCSSAFQAVLSDMYGTCNNEKPQSCTKANSHTVNVAIYATKFLGKVKALNKVKNSPSGFHANGRRADRNSQPGKNNVESTKRGWKLLRQCVNDLKAQKHTFQDTESRDIPVQSLHDLSDFERTRRDLYQRYGIIPTTRNDGTVTRKNTMLSERARIAPQSGDKSSTSGVSNTRPVGHMRPFASTSAAL